MRAVALLITLLACNGHSRRVQGNSEQALGNSYGEDVKALAMLLQAFNPTGVGARNSMRSAFGTPTLNTGRSLAALRMQESSSEPSSKAVTIGAAAVAGALGVQLFGELPPAILLSIVAAYASTLSNGLGGATKAVGGVAAKAYDKTVEINEEYDVLPKAKSAVDTVVTTVDNLNTNYGITEKIGIAGRLPEVATKVDEFKNTATAKIDELKAKASSKE